MIAYKRLIEAVGIVEGTSVLDRAADLLHHYWREQSFLLPCWKLSHTCYISCCFTIIGFCGWTL